MRPTTLPRRRVPGQAGQNVPEADAGERAGFFTTLGRWPRDLATLAAVVAVILGLDALSAFRPIGNAIVSAHMRVAPLEASGRIVFVAIDARSIQAIGPWPWSRRVFAELIRRLVDAGATEVFLDIDLSTPTSPGADAELARTLNRVGASVVLPVFLQQSRVAEPGAASNLPLEKFREATWLASVNVATDRDGFFRRYAYGEMIDGEDVPSAASLLSGKFGPAGPEFLVNFAIDPRTVPAVSAVDVLKGNAASRLRGRSVVIGPHALEIRETLPVPAHGPLAESMIQILAAETLAQGVALRPVNHPLRSCLRGSSRSA